jgi:hypothetical protein
VADAVPYRFQVAKPNEVTISGKDSAKNRSVFLNKTPEWERIDNGFGNNPLSDFTTQSRIPAKTKNQVKDARDSLGVSSKGDRMKVVLHAATRSIAGGGRKRDLKWQ